MGPQVLWYGYCVILPQVLNWQVDQNCGWYNGLQGTYYSVLLPVLLPDLPTFISTLQILKIAKLSYVLYCYLSECVPLFFFLLQGAEAYLSGDFQLIENPDGSINFKLVNAPGQFITNESGEKDFTLFKVVCCRLSIFVLCARVIMYTFVHTPLSLSPWLIVHAFPRAG